jgi:hypothetical protein
MPSFFLQEWNASIVTFCILELLLGWSCYFIQWRKELSVVRKTNRLNNNQVYILLQSLSRQFIHWQVCSVLLACAFVPYTFLFWRYISDYGDMRYLPHALIIHALWAFCWLAVSLPLMQTWYDWTLKQAMFSFQVKEPNESKESDESDEKNEADKFPSSPIGFLNVITTIVVALLTFGSPIIKAVSIGH